MVISDKVCQALNKNDGAWTVALDITKSSSQDEELWCLQINF